MKIKYELSEQELKEAVADWLGINQEVRITFSDVTITVHPGDPDPRSPTRPFATATATVESTT